MNNKKQAKIIVEKDRIECYILSYDYDLKMEYWGQCWSWDNEGMINYCKKYKPILLVRDIIDDIICLKNKGYNVTFKIIK